MPEYNKTEQILANLTFESLKEQRAKRRWGIFFKLAFLVYFSALLLLIFRPTSNLLSQEKQYERKPHVALINIKGVIAPNQKANAESLNQSLRTAFKSQKTLGIILKINSPGGSPVQSDEVFNQIMELRHQHPKKKIFAICEDVCASGAYYIASAANKIFANQASSVGSIGVLMQSFGAVGAMKKLGLTRRLYTAGSHKGAMDPFSTVNLDTRKHIQTMLDDIHQRFIARVKEGRGKQLNLKKKDIFSGRIWTGHQAIKYGLIDGFGNARQISETYFKSTSFRNYNKKVNPIQRVLNRFSTQVSSHLSSMIFRSIKNGLSSID